MTKLCVNCEHFGRNAKRLQGFATLAVFGASYSPPPLCKHPSLPKDLVYGAVIPVWADSARTPSGICGIEGGLFELEVIEPIGTATKIAHATPARKWWKFWQ